MPVFIAGSLLSCSRTKRNTAPQRFKNIIVLADAGKRLDLFRQADRDKSIIEKIYMQFEAAARKHFFVNSKDRLHILALPNAQTDHLLMPLQEQLYIDMQAIPIKERARYIATQKDAFMHRLDSFYSLAALVPQKQPSNTWKFFNEQLAQYLKPDSSFDNYIIVLSDGYSTGVQAQDAVYTGSESLLQDARKSRDWEKFLAANHLKPVSLPQASIYMFFAEMNGASAYESFPDELKLVQQAWLSWAQLCNVSGVNKTLPRITEGNVNSEIAAFLQTVPATQKTGAGNEQYANRSSEPAHQPPPGKATANDNGTQTVIAKPAMKQTSPENNDKPANGKKPSGNDDKGGFIIRQDF